MQIPITVAVPLVWRELLRLQEMVDHQLVPAVWDPSTKTEQEIADHITDASPWRDDEREMRFVEGSYRITVRLLSGNENYYLNFMVERSDTPHVPDSFARVDFHEGAEFSIPCDANIIIKGHNMIVLHVDGARIARVPDFL